MSQGRPRLFTAIQCAELWRQYKAGESLLGITRVLGRRHRVLQSTEGIAPAPRRRFLGPRPSEEDVAKRRRNSFSARPWARCAPRIVPLVLICSQFKAQE